MFLVCACFTHTTYKFITFYCERDHARIPSCSIPYQHVFVCVLRDPSLCVSLLLQGVEESHEIAAELKHQVRKVIGPFATPDYIILTAAFPKTRSGKVSP